MLSFSGATVKDSGRYFCYSVQDDMEKYIAYDVEVKGMCSTLSNEVKFNYIFTSCYSNGK